MILEKYAKDNGFENTLTLVDDGSSGTSFQRPIPIPTRTANQGRMTRLVMDSSLSGQNKELNLYVDKVSGKISGERFDKMADRNRAGKVKVTGGHLAS